MRHTISEKNFREIKNELIRLAHKYGGTVRIKNEEKSDSHGEFLLPDKRITVYGANKRPKLAVLATLAHEVRHLMQYKSRKYKNAFDGRHYTIYNAIMENKQIPKYKNYELPDEDMFYQIEIEATKWAVDFLKERGYYRSEGFLPKDATFAYEFYQLLDRLDITKESIGA
jgi:hypothetical protein